MRLRNLFVAALLLAFGAAPALAQQPPTPQQLQAQLNLANDQLEVARSDRTELLAKLDQQRALVKEIWQERQNLTTQLSAANKQRDDAKKEVADLKQQLAKAHPSQSVSDPAKKPDGKK